MDCGTARELLDAARSHPRDREDSRFEAAFAHLDECPACAEVFEFHQAIDRRVGEIIRQTPVPADLQARLSNSLSMAATLPQPESVRTADPRSMRRALLAAVSAAALLIATGVTWYIGHRTPAPLSAATVLDWWRARLEQPNGFDLRTLPEFDDEFDLSVGDQRWLGLSQETPRGADIDKDGRQDAAVVPIDGGFLVVLPADRVSDPPSARAARSGDIQYAPTLYVAWTHNHSMHFCFLPGGTPTGLQQLISKVYGNAA